MYHTLKVGRVLRKSRVAFRKRSTPFYSTITSHSIPVNLQKNNVLISVLTREVCTNTTSINRVYQSGVWRSSKWEDLSKTVNRIILLKIWSYPPKISIQNRLEKDVTKCQCNKVQTVSLFCIIFVGQTAGIIKERNDESYKKMAYGFRIEKVSKDLARRV